MVGAHRYRGGVVPGTVAGRQTPWRRGMLYGGRMGEYPGSDTMDPYRLNGDPSKGFRKYTPGRGGDRLFFISQLAVPPGNPWNRQHS